MKTPKDFILAALVAGISGLLLPSLSMGQLGPEILPPSREIKLPTEEVDTPAPAAPAPVPNKAPAPAPAKAGSASKPAVPSKPSVSKLRRAFDGKYEIPPEQFIIALAAHSKTGVGPNDIKLQLVNRKSGAVRFAKVGETIGEWTITDFSLDHATLETATHRAILIEGHNLPKARPSTRVQATPAQQPQQARPQTSSAQRNYSNQHNYSNQGNYSSQRNYSNQRSYNSQRNYNYQPQRRRIGQAQNPSQNQAKANGFKNRRIRGSFGGATQR